MTPPAIRDKRSFPLIIKIAFSVLAGIGISFASFYAFIIFVLFSAERLILLSLLGVFYISVMVFLILWNTAKTKKVYRVLFIPLACIAAGAAVIGYHDYIRKIPTVSEQNVYLHRYIPFEKDNLLAKLDGEPHIKITRNLPVLDGATALYPVYASFVQAVYPEAEYGFSDAPLLCNKTAGAYQNLLEGRADIIFCAGPSDAQLQLFYDRNVTLKLIPIGKEAFVFFVNSENPVDNVSTENIREIYSGKIKNWKELHGQSQRIKAFQRPANSGSQTMLEKIMGTGVIETPIRENVAEGMGGIINEVAVYRNFSNAIGYSFLYFATEMVKTEKIKLLSVDGIYPSKETIQNNSYPFSDNFYAIYIDDDEKNEHIELLTEWILSGQGQELISKTGYIPVKN